MPESQNVQIRTLGCKLNQYESDVIRHDLKRRGYNITGDVEKADWIIVNTCTVTAQAEAKSRKIIRSAHALPGVKVAVVGCGPQAYPESEVSQSGSEIVLGNSNKFSVGYYIRKFDESPESVPVKKIFNHSDSFPEADLSAEPVNTRAYLKIQEGCDYGCTYCIIPTARGVSRSRGINYIAEEARKLVDSGFLEVILTGVNLGTYQFQNGRTFHLVDVLEELLKIEQLKRIRLSSIEVNTITPELVHLIQTEQRLARHFHIPLQSGSEAVLRAMKRKYSSREYCDTIRWIQATIPDVSIGTDLIVGFPGETEDDFRSTVECVSELPLSYLHVFRYSPKEGTPAGQYPEKIPEREAKHRSQLLIKVSRELKSRFFRTQVGNTADVLVEKNTEDNFCSGFSSNYIRVYIPGNGTRIAKNTLINTKLESLFSDGMKGTALD